ncbi:hypothetical protein H9Y04_43935 [Streptomyces sp. TRM66268-LWL]|uniref:Uncharacterized protein n=2 Tax=Streptomyces polyasparticus TaxID=2767826 RepID=A0ABR7SVF8_9ACTN|nr:hypothetical protein [Streptomyces polyasparticus]
MDRIEELAETLATRHPLATMLTQLRPGRADLTTPAHFEPPPIPVSVTLGPDAVREAGLAHVRQAPGIPATEFGSTRRPALHYTLGNGTDPAAWKQLRTLNEHLKTNT